MSIDKTVIIWVTLIGFPIKFLKIIWNKIKGLVKKRPPSIETIVSEEKAVLNEHINQSEIFILYKETTDEKVKEFLLRKIAKQKTAKRIIEIAENGRQQNAINKKGRKRLYELHELRIELQILEEKIAVLDYADSQIVHAEYPDTSYIDRNIESLSSLLDRNKKNGRIELSNISISAFDNSFDELEKLIGNKSTLKRHSQREIEKQKQEVLFKNQIKQKLSSLETLINQNKLDEAKSLITILTNSIKPNYEKEYGRLKKVKEKYREKELQDYKKRQEEILCKQAEEANRIRILEEQQLEEVKIQREQQEFIEREQKEKEEKNKSKLTSLIVNKPNWIEFETILKENNINTLYHFTAKSNIKSIISNGGLYSWHYLDLNNIAIPYPGGDSLSRDLDKQYRLQDFVRLSFTKKHPMMYTAQNEGRISSPVILEVDINVCYFSKTQFANMNATKTGHNCGDSLNDLKAIKFNLVKLPKHFDIPNENDYKYYQAEVLVKTWIPLKYITNINDFEI